MVKAKSIIPNSLKRTVINLQWKYRSATSGYRILPSFLIIGAQRCGTTSLYHYLTQHPKILSSFTKEVHYFDGGLNPMIDNYSKGVDWYKSFFPLKREKEVITGEASPLYLFNPLAPKRIFDLLPEIKMIVLLRNPTERAISQYFHERMLGFEQLPIEEAIFNEEKRNCTLPHDHLFKTESFVHYSYKARGLYKKQIDNFLRYFPSKQMLILSSETFFREPEETLKRVFHFLELENHKIKNLTPRNIAPNKKKISKEVYNYLNKFFSHHNEALFRFLDEEFDW